jgi:hypothetical protein
MWEVPDYLQVPKEQQTQKSGWQKFVQSVKSALNGAPTDSQICEQAGITKTQLVEARQVVEELKKKERGKNEICVFGDVSNETEFAIAIAKVVNTVNANSTSVSSPYGSYVSPEYIANQIQSSADKNAVYTIETRYLDKFGSNDVFEGVGGDVPASNVMTFNGKTGFQALGGVLNQAKSQEKARVSPYTSASSSNSQQSHQSFVSMVEKTQTSSAGFMVR